MRVAQPDVRAVLAQLESLDDSGELAVAGHRVRVTSLGRELWPQARGRKAVTKRDLLGYYAQVSPWLLPHVLDRPMTVSRFPEGITGETFYQRHADKAPEYVERVAIYTEQSRKSNSFLLCQNLATLLYLGQMAVLELHVWMSRITRRPDAQRLGATFTGSLDRLKASVLNYPDFIAFDLDPYLYAGTERQGAEPALNRKAFRRTCELARQLHEEFDRLKLPNFIKTTGRTGLHLFLPIERRLDYDAVREAAGRIGQFLERRHPDRVTTAWSVKDRTGRVFFDANMNTRGKSLAAAFSPRRHPAATVSMPLRWDELDAVYPTDFTIWNAVEHVRAGGDPWASILEQKVNLSRQLARV